MSKGIKVGVVGGTGYTGVELLRLLAGHGGVELRRRRRDAVEPVKDFGVGTVEQGLEFAQFRIVERAEMRFGKGAEDQIGLARAAMPGAVEEPLAANVRRIRHPNSCR